MTPITEEFAGGYPSDEECPGYINNNDWVLLKTTGRKSGVTLAKKGDLSETSATQQRNIFPLRASNPILARSAVAMLGMGFIDAGYSGDWSRIGVISKETEDLLKFAAFGVVPLCLFLIFSYSKEPEA